MGKRLSLKRVAATAALVMGVATATTVRASPTVTYGYVNNSTVAPAFSTPPANAPGAYAFTTVPNPSGTDAAQGKTVTLAAGSAFNAASFPLSALTDGKVNVGYNNFNNTFVFADGVNGRLVLDLSSSIGVARVNTYGWEGDARSYQTYRLYAAASPSVINPDFTAAAFQNDAALASAGYAPLGTAADPQTAGGQHATSFSDTTGSLGTYRYLLFDWTNNSVGRAVSEIDVVQTPEPAALGLLGVAIGLLVPRRRHA